MAGSDKKYSHSTILFCLLFFSFSFLSMQQQDAVPESKKGTTIIVERATTTTFNRDINPDIYVLDGDVVFRHDSTLMYCDSAYLYTNTNSLEAFGKIFIEQGDSLFIYGDYLKYDGNTSLAILRENVRMENGGMTLYTDHFNYDRAADMAYYFDGGMLVDSLNELTSVYGQYSPQTKIATFQNIVELVNPQFTLESDTLHYNTATKIASIVSPSIIKGDSGVIYSDRGWYDTALQESMLFDRSTIVSKDGSKTMTADTLIYNRESGIGEAFSNMFLNDTVRKVILTGHYGFYNELTDYSFATDSAVFIEYSQIDSLYLHADTLKMITIGDEREIKAYRGVRFYRSDMQGVCDSMQYNTIDTMLCMYQDPILWNGSYQITGDTIKVLLNEETVERFEVLNYAFAIEGVDSLHFNQFKGRNIIARFRDGEPYKVEIHGNAESIYYPIEEGKGFIGMNKINSSFMYIDVVARKPVRILCYPEPDAVLLPIPGLTSEDQFLKDFINYDYLRPISKDDIFRPTVRKAEDVTAPRRKRSR